MRKVLIKINNHTGDMEAYTTTTSVLRALENPPSYDKIKYALAKYGYFNHQQFTIKIVYYAK